MQAPLVTRALTTSAALEARGSKAREPIFAQRAAKPLKTIKTAMGNSCKELAWIWGWRHIGLGSAPRPLGLGANWQLIPPTGGSSGFRGWYRHIVDVAFAQGGAGEARLGLEFWPDIAHGGAQAPGELVHDRLDRPTVGHLALDALGNQLHLVFDVLLEIAVGRALRHRGEAALVEEHFAGAVVRAGEQRASRQSWPHGRISAMNLPLRAKSPI